MNRVSRPLIAAAIGLAVGGAVALATVGGADSTPPPATPAKLLPEIGRGRDATEPATATAPKSTATTPTTSHLPSGDPAPQASASTTDAFGAALATGVRQAVASYGGAVEAAVWADGWERPVVRATVAGSAAGDPATSSSRDVRMWSMSKVPTAIATLQRTTDAPLSEGVRTALDGALVRSENCRQRRVVLDLQQRAGGTGPAATAVGGVLREADARTAQVARAAAAPEDVRCPPILGQLGATATSAPALLLGTSTWRVADAAGLGRGLADGRFGSAGREVRELLRQPKLRSRELISESDFTAPADWGVGVALRDFRPAYKAGWGGVNQQAFVAGQVAAVTVGGRAYGIAVFFHPPRQPTDDDPGKTKAPEVIETVLRPVAQRLHELEG